MKLAAVAIAFGMTLQQAPTFRSGAEAVLVPVSVVSGNRPVTDLKEADFELLDNGVRQTVKVVRLDDLAIDVTIVLDASGSVQGAALAQMQRDVQSIGDGLRTSDRVRILAFGDNVETVVPFTSGGAPLPIDRIAAGGATSLYSALAASPIVDPAVARPQLVFAMTDGRDNASLLDSSAVLALAGRSSACLYLALVDSSEPTLKTDTAGRARPGAEESTVLHPEQKGVYNGARAIRRTMGPYAGGPNVSVLKGIAARTGGGFYEHARPGTLGDVFRRALDDFRSSYLLSFTPSKTDSGWHDITVTVKSRRYIIRARTGYDGG